MDTERLTRIVGKRIQNISLFETAFTHKSYANEHPKYEHNERLEFLGDAVLELVVTEFLFQEFPKEPEGKMTKLRSALVSGVSLAQVAKKLNFGEFLLLSRGEESGGGREKNPILANTFEAVIGAIFLDSGFKTAKTFIERHLLPRLPEVLEKKLHVDPKSGFQEWSQEKLEITPEYRVLKEYGPDHDKNFLVGVFAGEQKMGEGVGSSKQKAEITAAKDALRRLAEVGQNI